MPHQCTNCGEIHEDGSDDIFDGCSNCDEGTFQFVPDSTIENTSEQDESLIDEAEPEQVEEDSAQKEARSQVVSDEELQEKAKTETEQQEDNTEDTETTPDTEQVRQVLNDQFESIKICSPGEYELNLMQLYENQDRVISLREDGRYAIHINE